MEDYVVTQLVEVQIYATDPDNAKDLAARSTTYWDDWKTADTPAKPEVRKGTLNDNSN